MLAGWYIADSFSLWVERWAHSENKTGHEKQPALLQAVKGIDGSDYYTLKYNLSFLCLAFTVGDGNAQLHAEIIIVVLSAGRGLHGYFVLIGKECQQCLGHVAASFVIIQAKGDAFDIGVL